LQSARRSYASWPSMWFEIKDPFRSVNHTFTKANATVLQYCCTNHTHHNVAQATAALLCGETRTLMWAPHEFYKNQGVPSRPPCKYHGWDCPDGVHFERWTRTPRRVLDIDRDFNLGTTEHCCLTHKKAVAFLCSLSHLCGSFIELLRLCLSLTHALTSCILVHVGTEAAKTGAHRNASSK
jgi:hypothetical protein